MHREGKELIELRTLMFHTAWRRLYRHVVSCVERFALSLAYSTQKLTPAQRHAAKDWWGKLSKLKVEHRAHANRFRRTREEIDAEKEREESDGE